MFDPNQNGNKNLELFSVIVNRVKKITLLNPLTHITYDASASHGSPPSHLF